MKKGWIEEEEMLDLTAIAQASPGAIAVNASIMLGYHIAGIPGAILAVLGTVLPPLIIISIISMFYQAFRNNVIVSMAMRSSVYQDCFFVRCVESLCLPLSSDAPFL